MCFIEGISSYIYMKKIGDGPDKGIFCARAFLWYHSDFVAHVTWSKLLLIKYRDQRYIPTSNTQIKDIYTYSTYIKYKDKISVINRQSQLTTFTSNQPTDALALGVHYDCFCLFILRTIEFDLSGVIYMHFKSTKHRNIFKENRNSN